MSTEFAPIPPELLADEPPFTDEDIDRWLDAPADENWAEDPAVHPPARWVIDGDNTAAWAMAKYGALTQELHALAVQAQDWRDRIDQWFEQKATPLRRHASFFEGHLMDYALRVREASGEEIKTVVLPNGKVPTTGHQAKVVVSDPEAFVAWARKLDPEDYQATVQVSEKPILSGVRAMVEVVPVADEVILSCGCVTNTVDGRLVRAGETAQGGKWAPATWTRVWLGDGVLCPECDEDALVGNVSSYHLETQHPALGDVPGTTVEPGSVSVRVVPDAG